QAEIARLDSQLEQIKASSNISFPTADAGQVGRSAELQEHSKLDTASNIKQSREARERLSRSAQMNPSLSESVTLPHDPDPTGQAEIPDVRAALLSASGLALSEKKRRQTLATCRPASFAQHSAAPVSVESYLQEAHWPMYPRRKSDGSQDAFSVAPVHDQAPLRLSTTAAKKSSTRVEEAAVKSDEASVRISPKVRNLTRHTASIEKVVSNLRAMPDILTRTQGGQGSYDDCPGPGLSQRTAVPSVVFDLPQNGPGELDDDESHLGGPSSSSKLTNGNQSQHPPSSDYELVNQTSMTRKERKGRITWLRRKLGNADRRSYHLAREINIYSRERGSDWQAARYSPYPWIACKRA
ncbi:MAG: hypothetical protein Q9187_009667, partial [Circinaria calcarea]